MADFIWSKNGGPWEVASGTPNTLLVASSDTVDVRPLGPVQTLLGQALRTVPAGSDRFYVVAKFASFADAIRFERNLGGNGGTDAGVSWPEWRVTGRGRLPSFDANPASPLVLFTDDNGAQDITAYSGSKYYGSYHGLGSAGALLSQTITMDGANLDPAVATTGNVFVLRNQTKADDGTSVFTRDLTTSIGVGGQVRYTLNSISVSNIQRVTLAQVIGQSGYDEIDVQVTENGPWLHLPPVGISTLVYTIAATIGVKGVRLRNTTTGASVQVVGSALAGLTGYAYSDILRASGSDRLKAYLGRYSDVSALAGASWSTFADVVPVGSQFGGANLFTNGDFATGDLTGWSRAQGTGTVSVVSNAMRMTRQAASQNRYRQTAGFNFALTDLVAYHLDFTAISGGSNPKAKVSPSTALGATNIAIDDQLTQIGRFGYLFKPTATTLYAGLEVGTGTDGQTIDTDNYGMWKVVA